MHVSGMGKTRNASTDSLVNDLKGGESRSEDDIKTDLKETRSGGCGHDSSDSE
jgi:hypothetical protein